MQRIEFSAPLADAKNFPQAQISVHPSFSWRFWQWRPNAFTKKDFLFCLSGAAALYLAAQQLKKSQANLVLLPAYHCPALVEPFVAAGYHIRFYPLRDDLSIDRDALRAMLVAEVTHVLVVRYFGKTGDLDEVLQELQQAGVVTFDDCAHDMQSFLDKTKTSADAKICSLPKFIAVSDGGLLHLKSGCYPTLLQQPWQAEAKNLLSYFKLPGLSLFRKTLKRKAAVAAKTSATNNSSTFRYLRPEDKVYACLRLTRYLSRHTNLSLLLMVRRLHSHQLQTALMGAAIGMPLWSSLQQEAPYVLPFLLHKPEDFAVLRNKGLQIYRWEELAQNNCEISRLYRGRLIQIPCHQTLSTEELKRLAGCFNNANDQA